MNSTPVMAQKHPTSLPTENRVIAQIKSGICNCPKAVLLVVKQIYLSHYPGLAYTHSLSQYPERTNCKFLKTITETHFLREWDKTYVYTLKQSFF
jgi:hypothetical protein